MNAAILLGKIFSHLPFFHISFDSISLFVLPKSTIVPLKFLN